ncbi:MAG: ATP-binding protein [Oscillospiraceae bacterium]|nr:ATP-binding protein [Oscillospiraceae bacterium]
MFVGRRSELNKLDTVYASDKFECVIMYGKRRTGKTALLREFLVGKNGTYFAALESSSRENLNSFISSVEAIAGKSLDGASAIATFEDALVHLGKMAQTERIILIIDDYQFLVTAFRGISEQICQCIDKHLKNTKLMMIICGSSELVMERETLGYDSPFHGRRTAQMSLQPFNFFETRRLYTDFSPFDIAVIYGLTGGVPKYLEQMDPELSIEENIRQNFFNPSSLLFEEPANILRREIRDPTYYNAILRAISIGLTKNSEISAEVGLESSACTAYLKNLIALGLIGKYTPVTEKAGKKTIYEIEDSMFHFWYRFVQGNISHIQNGMADKIWRGVAREIPSFMSMVFTNICRQWLDQRSLAGRLPLTIVEMGRWWGMDPVWKTETSVPIVAYSDDENAIFADCDWSEEPTGANALNSLFERSRLFRYENRHLYLFSRSGFSEECTDTARRIGATLVSFE